MQEEKLNGIVESLVFQAADNTFAVIKIRDECHNIVTVTINTMPPIVGQEVELTGNWFRHHRFGQQFKASGIRVHAPSNLEGIERFLASGVIDGIGPAMAKRIVTMFGDESLKIIENHPDKLTRVAGIGAKTVEKIRKSYSNQSELHQLMRWLEERGISGTYAARIFKQYGSFSIEIIEDNPYRLAQEVDGIGFRTADMIAKAIGIANNSQERMSAGIAYVLSQISLNGHTCVPEGELAYQSARVLNVDKLELLTAIKEELKNNRLTSVEEYGDRLIYAPYLYEAEKNTADKLLELRRNANKMVVNDIKHKISQWEKFNNKQLAEAQREAIISAIYSGVLVITGGPGTGKTTIIRGIIDILESIGKTVLLGAPTGRAAKRLSDTTEHEAFTIHRMLESQGISDNGEQLFMRDEDDKLEADVIILDEASMIDVILMSYLLAATPIGAHLIMVGDVDQLPAVGPGAVLKDILRSSSVHYVRLTEVFRQENTSSIITNAHNINAGKMPVFSSDDFRFIEAEGETAQKYIVELYQHILPAEGYNKLFDIQVISPMHRELCGVDALNRKLQETLNPYYKGIREMAVGTYTYREGDKVIQVKNDYIKDVFNGDIGIIKEIAADNIIIDFSGRYITYSNNELNHIKLAYAMSVHKSQGGEYPVIILPLVKAHQVMLQRNLLYTAVTRAKQKVIIVGSRSALFTAVSNNRTQRRYTLLAERLAKGLE